MEEGEGHQILGHLVDDAAAGQSRIIDEADSQIMCSGGVSGACKQPSNSSASYVDEEDDSI